MRVPFSGREWNCVTGVSDLGRSFSIKGKVKCCEHLLPCFFLSDMLVDNKKAPNRCWPHEL